MRLTHVPTFLFCPEGMGPVSAVLLEFGNDPFHGHGPVKAYVVLALWVDVMSSGVHPPGAN